MDVPAAASAAASRADEPCPPDATVSCVTADDGTALHVRCEWRHGERSFDALVVGSLVAGRARHRLARGEPAPATQRAVPRLVRARGGGARGAGRPPPLRLLPRDVHIRPRRRRRPRGVPMDVARAPPAAGFRRRSWRERRRAPREPGPRARGRPAQGREARGRRHASRRERGRLRSRVVARCCRRDKRRAQTRRARAHERDADELRAAVDHAHGELRALADIAETRERDADCGAPSSVNENAAGAELEDALEAARNEVARLERRAEGADGGADPDEDDGLGVDTDEEREAERREVERRRRGRRGTRTGTGRGRDGDGRDEAKAKTETDPRAKTEKTETGPRAKTETDPRAKTETDPRATDPDPEPAWRRVSWKGGILVENDHGDAAAAIRKRDEEAGIVLLGKRVKR